MPGKQYVVVVISIWWQRHRWGRSSCGAAAAGAGTGAAGTVAGALIGREHSKNKQKNSRIVGYKQQETCSVTTVMLEENISEVTGYRNHIEVDGKIVKLESKSPLSVGSRVEMVRRVSYSLR